MEVLLHATVRMHESKYSLISLISCIPMVDVVIFDSRHIVVAN